MSPSRRIPSGRASVLRRRHGFTLIEVLVSLAIFVGAAVVLSAAYLNIINSYRAVASRQAAEEDWKWLRMTVLSEADRAKVEDGGRLDLPEGRLVTWSARVEPTAVADLFQIQLSAELPPEPGGERTKRETTVLVYRPKWSDPTDRDGLRDATRRRLVQERNQ